MARLTAREHKEWVQFQADLATQAARLREFALPYTRWLPPAELEIFLSHTLKFAWQRRKEFDPGRASLLQWWGGCLKSAAMTRETWTQRHMDWWETISANRLGREEFCHVSR